jgi:hypothetical protein
VISLVLFFLLLCVMDLLPVCAATVDQYVYIYISRYSRSLLGENCGAMENIVLTRKGLLVLEKKKSVMCTSLKGNSRFALRTRQKNLLLLVLLAPCGPLVPWCHMTWLAFLLLLAFV